MNARPFWQSLAVQTVAVAVLSGILVALPLGDDFFDDWGFAAGPLAWLACTLVTARVLTLPVVFALFSALAGGVAGTIVMLATTHWAGVAAALLVFAASCGSYDPAAEHAAAE